MGKGGFNPDFPDENFNIDLFSSGKSGLKPSVSLRTRPGSAGPLHIRIRVYLRSSAVKK
jgi:hypothetical protein